MLAASKGVQAANVELCSMTPNKRNALTLNDWLGKFSGEPCYILGNGPSLDVESLAGIDAVTLGINRFYPPYSTYQPAALIYQDERIRDELRIIERDGTARLASVEIGCSAMSRPRFDRQRTILQVKTLPTRDTEDAGKRHTMPSNFACLYRNHSHALAFQVAYLWGCDPIIFAGVDCSYDYESDKTNYYDCGRPQGAEHNSETLKRCKRGSEWVAANAAGRRVINCGLDCSLGPRRDLREVTEAYRGLGDYRERLLASKLHTLA